MKSIAELANFLKVQLNVKLQLESNLKATLGDFIPSKILSLGKASCNLAEGAKSIFPNCNGLAVTKYGHGFSIPDFKVIEASHPVPDENSVKAASTVIDFVDRVDEPLLVLISGGASALLCAPIKGISLTDKMEITSLLLGSGATIEEINLVRKSLSRIKGGGLSARMSSKQLNQVRVAVISDVVGNDLSTISSGPFFGPTPSISETFRILQAYEVNLSKALEESLIIRDHNFVKKNPVHYILSDVNQAIKLTKSFFRDAGYLVQSYSEPLNGPIQENVQQMLDWLTYHPGSVWISGGECTVKLVGDGFGGRNQQWALEAAIALIDRGFSDFETFSYATDGNDGPTDSAGGWVCSSWLAENMEEAQTAVKRNDSYPFLKKFNGHLMTGPTGTNINDVRGVLFKPQTIRS